jgi:hypothetical protein
MTSTLSVAAPHRPQRYWRSPAIWLALFAGLAFLAAGLRLVALPTAASASFGMPMLSESEIFFVQVYGSRTILLALVAIALVVIRQLAGLVALLTLALPLPIFDIWLLSTRHGFGPELGRHLAYLALLAVTAGLLWQKFLSDRRAAA